MPKCQKCRCPGMPCQWFGNENKTIQNKNLGWSQELLVIAVLELQLRLLGPGPQSSTFLSPSALTWGHLLRFFLCLWTLRSRQAQTTTPIPGTPPTKAPRGIGNGFPADRTPLSVWWAPVPAVQGVRWAHGDEEMCVLHKERGTSVRLHKTRPTWPMAVFHCLLWYTSRLTRRGTTNKAAAHQPPLKRHFVPRELIIDRKTHALFWQTGLAILEKPAFYFILFF